jgi:hypothetical protein
MNLQKRPQIHLSPKSIEFLNRVQKEASGLGMGGCLSVCGHVWEYHHFQKCSSKGVCGWQVEAVILATTALARAPLHQVGQSQSAQSSGGSHETPNQVGQSWSPQSVPRGRDEGSSARI